MEPFGSNMVSDANIIRRMLVLSLDAPNDINLLFGAIISPMPEIFDLIAPHMRRVRLLHIPFHPGKTHTHPGVGLGRQMTRKLAFVLA
jgi:hypothetical protein